MEGFAACFSELEDPREDNARHDLHAILVIAYCAMLCGAEDCSDMAVLGRAKEGFLRRFRSCGGNSSATALNSGERHMR